MTNPVRLTINGWDRSLWGERQVCGSILSEGQTDAGEDFVLFQDGEDQKRKILKRHIKKISADVHQDTT